MNRVAISILSLAVVVGCSPDSPQLAALPEEGRLDPRVAPTAQFVSLDLDARRESYAGSVRIELGGVELAALDQSADQLLQRVGARECAADCEHDLRADAGRR